MAPALVLIDHGRQPAPVCSAAVFSLLLCFQNFASTAFEAKQPARKLIRANIRADALVKRRRRRFSRRRADTRSAAALVARARAFFDGAKTNGKRMRKKMRRSHCFDVSTSASTLHFYAAVCSCVLSGCGGGGGGGGGSVQRAQKNVS